MADPRAGACSEADTLMGTLSTSAMVCITKGDFLATSPIAITASMAIPSSFSLSTIFLDPKHNAATRAFNTRAASVPGLIPIIAPVKVGLVSGVRRPLIQAKAIAVVWLAGIVAGWPDR